jgi:hypothetical protein
LGFDGVRPYAKVTEEIHEEYGEGLTGFLCAGSGDESADRRFDIDAIPGSVLFNEIVGSLTFAACAILEHFPKCFFCKGHFAVPSPLGPPSWITLTSFVPSCFTLSTETSRKKGNKRQIDFGCWISQEATNGRIFILELR